MDILHLFTHLNKISNIKLTQFRNQPAIKFHKHNRFAFKDEGNWQQPHLFEMEIESRNQPKKNDANFKNQINPCIYLMKLIWLFYGRRNR